MRVGKLLAISGSEQRIGDHWFVLCRCDCGVEKAVRRSHLLNQQVKSCGCLRRRTKRGYVAAKVPEFWVWVGIKQRCLNPKRHDWKKYGGRGIKICPEWEHSFETFLADMGPRPTKEHSIERIDNSLGYTPTNCRWATLKEQARNTRANHMLQHAGKMQCVSAWAEELGVDANFLLTRLKRGWSAERTLTTPHLWRRK